MKQNFIHHNPKLQGMRAEIHRIQTIVDKRMKLSELQKTGNCYRYHRSPRKYWELWLDLCNLKNEYINYVEFLIRKVIV